jgi:hypothetical protein
MNPRTLLTAPIAVLAAAVLPALAQAPAAVSAMPAIPTHNCVAPEYPTKPSVKLRVDTFNQKVEAFNRDNKTYSECIKKYVDDTNRLGKAAADAANKAIDEYNKYNEELKQKIEAEN